MTEIIHINFTETCARAAHEAIRAYCLALGDESQLPWDSAPEWQRESTRCGVRGVFQGNTPRQSHQSWLDEKATTGWVYGPVKDPEKKQHPCIVPYDELPLEQQQKDQIFVAVVSELQRALNSVSVNRAL
jgi:hypothetical protein